MSFTVQISPFVHLCMLKIFFRKPAPGLCPGPAAALKRPPEPSPQVVPTFHFIPSYAPAYHAITTTTATNLESKVLGTIMKTTSQKQFHTFKPINSQMTCG